MRGYEKDPPAFPRSLWTQTASPGQAFEPLDGGLTTSVAIIGAGFTGLSCALHLREKGVDCVVLDARDVGWGASGRNNGQVIPGLKLDPDDFVALLGDAGERMVRAAGDAPALVFDVVHRYAIACEAVNRGWVQPAHGEGALRGITSRMAQWQKRGARVEWVEQSNLERVLGTRWYKGAWKDFRGGSINPLGYVRGFASAANRLGAHIHIKTSVHRVSRSHAGWTLLTDRGTVTADSVVIATNAYSDNMLSPLGSTIVPVRSAQVATAPLAEDKAATILPGGECASDTRRLLTSFRLTPDRRLVMGGSGATGGSCERPMVAALHRTAMEIFPQLGKIDWEFSWSGVWAVTTDHLPHLHEPAPGLWAALGCNGRGIGLATLWGKTLANRLAGVPMSDLPFPVTSPRSLLLGQFYRLGIPLVVATWRMLDAWDRR